MTEVKKIVPDNEVHANMFQPIIEVLDGNQERDDKEDAWEASPTINLQDLKVSELIELKKLVNELYGEWVFYKVVEEDMATLLVKEKSDNGAKEGITLSEGQEKISFKDILTCGGEGEATHNKKLPIEKTH